MREKNIACQLMLRLISVMMIVRSSSGGGGGISATSFVSLIIVIMIGDAVVVPVSVRRGTWVGRVVIGVSL